MPRRTRHLNHRSLLNLALAIALAIALGLALGTSSTASVKAKGKVVSMSLSKTSFTAARAGSVKLKCKISPKSGKLNYLLQKKKGAKWTKVRAINKKGSFGGTYTMTVKKLFGSKARSAGKYRVKISADGNSRTKSFTIKAAADNETSLRVETFSVSSPALGFNMLGDSASGTITVVLPPSYDRETSRRYPVVYFLHGFHESHSEVVSWDSYLRRAMANGKELIVASVQGTNRLGGGFYVNSQVSGRFEDWVVSEAVAAVDARFRTRADRASRGLAGFSMGGFGAVNLALRHPDVYSATFAMSGGFLAPGALQGAFSSWDNAFLQAYGAAFAPDPTLPDPYARIPAFSGTPEDDAVVALWESGFGNWDAKLAAYAAETSKLASIRIQWGDADFYSWIPTGSAWLVGAMQSAGLPVESNHFPTLGHALPPTEISDSLVPFFQRRLAFS